MRSATGLISSPRSPFLVAIACVTGLAVTTADRDSQAGDPQPIGAFLNGVMPTTTPSGGTSWQITEAFPNLTFNPLAGLRYHYLRQKINLTPGPSVGDSFDWVEPVVGGRVILTLNEKVDVRLAVDVGGFGIGSASDLTSNFLLTTAITVSESVGIRIGKELAPNQRTLGGRRRGLCVLSPVYSWAPSMSIVDR